MHLYVAALREQGKQATLLVGSSGVGIEEPPVIQARKRESGRYRQIRVPSIISHSAVTVRALESAR